MAVQRQLPYCLVHGNPHLISCKQCKIKEKFTFLFFIYGSIELDELIKNIYVLIFRGKLTVLLSIFYYIKKNKNIFFSIIDQFCETRTEMGVEVSIGRNLDPPPTPPHRP